MKKFLYPLSHDEIVQQRSTQILGAFAETLGLSTPSTVDPARLADGLLRACCGLVEAPLGDEYPGEKVGKAGSEEQWYQLRGSSLSDACEPENWDDDNPEEAWPGEVRAPYHRVVAAAARVKLCVFGRELPAIRQVKIAALSLKEVARKCGDDVSEIAGYVAAMVDRATDQWHWQDYEKLATAICEWNRKDIVKTPSPAFRCLRELRDFRPDDPVADFMRERLHEKEEEAERRESAIIHKLPQAAQEFAGKAHAAWDVVREFGASAIAEAVNDLLKQLGELHLPEKGDLRSFVADVFARYAAIEAEEEAQYIREYTESQVEAHSDLLGEGENTLLLIIPVRTPETRQSFNFDQAFRLGLERAAVVGIIFFGEMTFVRRESRPDIDLLAILAAWAKPGATASRVSVTSAIRQEDVDHTLAASKAIIAFLQIEEAN